MVDAPFAYMGGKSRLAPFIESHFPPHSCYCEVFGGAAWVLFYKRPSNFEVYNDINNDLVNLFWQLKTNVKEVIKKAIWLPYSRTLFDAFAKTYQNEQLTDVEKAVRFLYLNKCAYSGQFLTKISSGPTHSPNWHTEFVKDLVNTRRRFDKVIIENLSYHELIPKYDSPDTLFYLDPPYLAANKTKYYKYVFGDGDHDRLADLCHEIKGKFILSYEDHPRIRTKYADFFIHTTPEVVVSSSNKEKKDVIRELIITNFRKIIKQGRLF